MHVRHIKSLKWLLVIVPIKEQLYPEPTANVAAATLVPPILNNNLGKSVLEPSWCKYAVCFDYEY